MKEVDIKTLLEKYYQGETSLEEEQLLREKLIGGEFPEEFEYDQSLFTMFYEAGKNTSPEFEFVPPIEKIHDNDSKGHKQIQMTWFSGIAASLGLLLTGLVMGLLLMKGNDSRELVALREDIREIKSMTTARQLNAESASDRILAAYQAGTLDEADDETISALLNVLTLDENVNVRIAAADALFKFGNLPIVRKAFIQALSIEEDPNLQIRLINMLVTLQEKSALPKLREMTESENSLPVVRQTAAKGMMQLL